MSRSTSPLEASPRATIGLGLCGLALLMVGLTTLLVHGGWSPASGLLASTGSSAVLIGAVLLAFQDGRRSVRATAAFVSACTFLMTAWFVASTTGNWFAWRAQAAFDAGDYSAAESLLDAQDQRWRTAGWDVAALNLRVNRYGVIINRDMNSVLMRVRIAEQKGEPQSALPFAIEALATERLLPAPDAQRIAIIEAVVQKLSSSESSMTATP